MLIKTGIGVKHPGKALQNGALLLKDKVVKDCEEASVSKYMPWQHQFKPSFSHPIRPNKNEERSPI